MFNLIDLLVYTDWLEDQGKDTTLLRDNIEEFILFNIFTDDITESIYLWATENLDLTFNSQHPRSSMDYEISECYKDGSGDECNIYSNTGMGCGVNGYGNGDGFYL